jgi:TPR repeat protein
MRLTILAALCIVFTNCSYNTRFKHKAEKGKAEFYEQYQAAITIQILVYLDNPTEKNLKKAQYWIDFGAQYNDAYCMYLKTQFIKNDTQKRYWLQKSANEGFVDAMQLLGVLWLDSKGGEGNIDSAIYWLTNAANLNHNVASQDLGDIYYTNHYGKQNFDSAFYWFSKACYQNHKPRQSCCEKALTLITQNKVTNLDSLQKRIISDRIKELERK